MTTQILKTLILALMLFGHCYGEEHRITPETDLKKLSQNVSAGDTIVLENGIWKDLELKFDLPSGTEESPITIVAETAGQVIFSGETRFRVAGQHIIVSGMVFRDCTSDKDALELRTDKARPANHSRVTQCVFEQTKEFKTSQAPKWLSIHGSDNRVDHCYFTGKRTNGTTLVVWLHSEPGKHRIDHNFFGPRPELGQNGGETIRIGTSTFSESVCKTVVEDNYFYQCNGETEVISNKSCENIYRHNLFDECEGTLTLRHGHRCVVDGNVFLGRQKNRTGGVRIIGKGHRVINNYFEGLRGDKIRAAVCLMNGIPNGPLNGYAPVEDAIVAHNTIVDCTSPVAIGVGVGSRNRTVVPKNCLVANNVFGDGQQHPVAPHVEPANFVWKGNKQQTGNGDNHKMVKFDRVDLRLVRAPDGMMRPADAKRLKTRPVTKMKIKTDVDGGSRNKLTVAGCDDPKTKFREFATPANTGPDWWRAAKH